MSHVTTLIRRWLHYCKWRGEKKDMFFRLIGFGFRSRVQHCTNTNEDTQRVGLTDGNACSEFDRVSKPVKAIDHARARMAFCRVLLNRTLAFMMLIVIALIASAKANASVTLSWQNASSNEDGSEIPQTGNAALMKTTIKFSLCVNSDLDENNAQFIEVAPDITTHTFDPGPGDWCFRATHTNNAGVESDVSNLAVKTVLPPSPLPPSNLQVAVDNTIVYGVYKKPGAFYQVPLGWVSAGVACDSSQYILSAGEPRVRYVVPTEAVEWASSVESDVVVADCE